MKNGAMYGKRVEGYFKKLKGTVSADPKDDTIRPIEQLMIAQLSWDAAPTNAQRAWRSLAEEMIDLNEVRVSTPREIAAVVRDFVPNAMECARGISLSLNGIYRRENTVDLGTLGAKGRREARQYLESLDGVNAYVAASVLLWSLGGHAIPVNQRLLRALRKEDLVDPEADSAVVQAFLERHVSAVDAKVFCQLMEKLAAQKGAPPAPPKTAKDKTVSSKTGTTGRKVKAARR